jgi:dihydroorotase
MEAPWTVTAENILYKCKWSPFTGKTFRSKVLYTFVNGRKVYENQEGSPENCSINKDHPGMRLEFDR